MQATSREAINHIVQASGYITNTMELINQYMEERKEIECASPHWSHMGSMPSTNRVHKVPPLFVGGQTLQPVVALSRTLLDSSISKFDPNKSIFNT